ncbi:FAD-binding oxidoreductase [Gryllotalpicola protaetiae]|uniref:FAD-binding protein n=1 Tax=Gryllotalpicola protaetiae TaxID=2419771 RepID=A0A387BU17_9MICO|nr:FAD-linked oxidase C-terminal domain-containing protein [Gryllotalpicola protaetiae]AYG04509.1 FAD-binding protein [Gryllotalpicola protaetiae]
MDLVARLTAELGDVVTIDPVRLEAVRTDKSGFLSASAPLALVEASSVDHVQTTLRLANEAGVGVVPRGTGTGLAAGAVGDAGVIVLSVAKMNQIIEIDPANELAVVEPGVINADLDAALEPYGLWYAPDPASKAISSIGGNIATNAGGLLCAKYGVTREAVLGLKVVLADGRLLTTGHRTVKGVTGYDLTALFVGSEGTLGVVVEATVRVLPRPAGDVVTVGAFFPQIRQAAAASSAVVAARLRPAVMELLDGQALEAIRAYLGDEVIHSAMGHASGDGFLLVQFDESPAPETVLHAVELIEQAGGQTRVSTDAATGEQLLSIRRAFHPALAARGEVLIEDVSVPRSRLADAFDAIAEISARYGVRIPTVAHAGDGNLHPNFVVDGGAVTPVVQQAADALFRVALALGGTLTGEHGVGILKRHHLIDELGPDSYALQRQVKTVFDPRGILNPGKVFEIIE